MPNGSPQSLEDRVEALERATATAGFVANCHPTRPNCVDLAELLRQLKDDDTVPALLKEIIFRIGLAALDASRRHTYYFDALGIVDKSRIDDAQKGRMTNHQAVLKGIDIDDAPGDVAIALANIVVEMADVHARDGRCNAQDGTGGD